MPDKQSPSDHEVSQTAFLIWLDEGKPDGMAEEHWFRAKELLAARDTFAASPEPKPRATRARKAAAAPDEAAPAPKTRRSKPVA